MSGSVEAALCNLARLDIALVESQPSGLGSDPWPFVCFIRKAMVYLDYVLRSPVDTHLFHQLGEHRQKAQQYNTAVTQWLTRTRLRRRVSPQPVRNLVMRELCKTILHECVRLLSPRV
jgi:hypothetical protein